MGKILVAGALALVAGAAAAQTGTGVDPLALQRAFKTRLEAAPAPTFDQSAVRIPGAEVMVGLTTTGRCTSRVDVSRNAFTYNGQKVPAAQASADIDWSKVLYIDYAESGDNKTFAIATATEAVDFPIVNLGNLAETAFALQLACNAFSAANAGLPPGAARWKQVRDPEWKASMTCLYAKVPELEIRQGWGGRNEVVWEQDFEKAGGEAFYTSMKVAIDGASFDSLVYDTVIELDEATGSGFTTKANSAELLLDGKPLGVPFVIRHDQVSQGRFLNIDIKLRDDGGPQGLGAKLLAGKELVAIGRDAKGRTMRRAVFDVSSLRNARAALQSTNARCVMD